MKKTANHVLTTLVVFLALMLLLMPSAFADGGRGVCETLPHGLPSGWKAPETGDAYVYAEMAEETPAAGAKAAGTKAGGLTVSVSQSGTIPGPMTWTASASGGNGSYSYEFKLYIPKLVDGVMWHYVKAKQDYSSSRVFHHTFTENGEYELAVNVKDSSGKTGSKILQISVHEEGMDPLTASFNAPSGAYFTTTTTWSMNVSGGDGNYSYMFWFYWEDAPIPMSVISGDDTYGPESAFHYRLLASGTYKLIGFVMDGNGQRAQDTIVFTAQSPDYPSVPEIARRLAAQCVSAGCRTAYEKALWMHDWLIYHADYDHSFTHYGPDGVLCAGSGVCESYAFAYAYLMRELGIPCEFASAENHMWNMIQLDGEWYHVDTTWDDPTDASTGGGGLERHLYFCVPWEVIAVDHIAQDRSVDISGRDLYVGAVRFFRDLKISDSVRHLRQNDIPDILLQYAVSGALKAAVDRQDNVVSVDRPCIGQFALLSSQVVDADLAEACRAPERLFHTGLNTDLADTVPCMVISVRRGQLGRTDLADIPGYVGKI